MFHSAMFSDVISSIRPSVRKTGRTVMAWIRPRSRIDSASSRSFTGVEMLARLVGVRDNKVEERFFMVGLRGREFPSNINNIACNRYGYKWLLEKFRSAGPPLARATARNEAVQNGNPASASDDQGSGWLVSKFPTTAVKGAAAVHHSRSAGRQ